MNLKKLASKFIRRGDEFPAVIGLEDGTIDVPNRAGYRYYRDTNGAPGEAYRGSTPRVAGLPVVIGTRDGRLTMLRTWDVFGDAPAYPDTAEHANSHRYMTSDGVTGRGYDWLPVEMRQIMACRVQCDNATLKIDIGRGNVYLDNVWLRYPGETDYDLTASVPVSGALWALITIYNNAGTPTIATTAGSAADINALAYSDIPAPPAGHLPLAAVRLYADQTAIEETAYMSDVIDLRQFGVGSTKFGGLFDYIQFNTSYVTSDAEPTGTMFWDTDNHTATLVLENGVRLQIGQEGHFVGVNKTGSSIPNGTPVYISGAQGNRPTIAPCKGDSDTTARCAGVTTQAIDDNAEGYVTYDGLVRQMTTLGSFAEGDSIWVSKTTAGAIVNAEPAVPHHSDFVGYVISNHATQGILLVKIQRHVSIEELSDVDGSAPVAGDLLQFDGSKWTPKSPTELGIMQNVYYSTTTTHNLPAATGSNATYRLISSLSETLTITPDGTDTIKGRSGSVVLSDGEDLIISDVASGKWY